MDLERSGEVEALSTSQDHSFHQLWKTLCSVHPSIWLYQRMVSCFGLQRKEEKKKAEGLYLCQILWEDAKGGSVNKARKLLQVLEVGGTSGHSVFIDSSLGINVKTR